MKRCDLRLRDGRLLRYLVAEIGRSAAPAARLVYHHGWPSSATEAAGLIAPTALASHIQMVAFDRPGVGGSSLDLGLSFQSVAADVAELMRALGWQSAIQCGTSGGGPYAAACAALLPERHGLRVDGLVLLASMTRTCGTDAPSLLRGMDTGNRLGYAVINNVPALGRAGVAAAAAVVQHVAVPLAALRPAREPPPPPPLDDAAAPLLDASPGTSRGIQSGLWAGVKRAAWKLATVGMAAADREALGARLGSAGPKLLGMARASFGGPRYALGLWQDMRLTSQPWNFSLSAIHCPTLVVQGTADVNVTVGMAQYLAGHIPGARQPCLHPLVAGCWPGLPAPTPSSNTPPPPGLVLLPGEGHLSLILNHMPRVMKAAAQLPNLQQSPHSPTA